MVLVIYGMMLVPFLPVVVQGYSGVIIILVGAPIVLSLHEIKKAILTATPITRKQLIFHTIACFLVIILLCISTYTLVSGGGWQEGTGFYGSYSYIKSDTYGSKAVQMYILLSLYVAVMIIPIIFSKKLQSLLATGLPNSSLPPTQSQSVSSEQSPQNHVVPSDTPKPQS